MLTRLYHAHHAPHLEDLPFWLELARQLQQGSPILELGCGSGRILLPLTRDGYTLVGLERDPDMLTTLREGMEPGMAGQVELVQGDMAAFTLGRRFPLIILPCNTFSTLSPAQRQGTLECVREHLQPDGLFVASLPNPVVLKRLPRHSEPEIEESFPHPLDGEPVQVSSAWERSAHFLTIYWHYDHLLPDGRVERVSTQVSHTLTPMETYLAELDAAGLYLAASFGDFDRSLYTQEAPSLILLARLRF